MSGCRNKKVPVGVAMRDETDISDIEKIDEAWFAVESAIRDLGAVIRRETSGRDALHRFEGYKALLAAVADNYINQLRFDRKRPECLPTLGPGFNYGASNPDFLYKVIQLEPGVSYRVWGQRGDAELIDVQQMASWFGQSKEDGKRAATALTNELFDEKNLTFDDQGNFDFILSADQRPGDWWQLRPGVTTLFIREYFTDYERQGRPSTFHADKLAAVDEGATIPGSDEAADALHAVARALGDVGFSFAMPTNFAGFGDNRFREISFGAAAGANDQRYFQARFNLNPTEALVGTWVVPPDYLYWGITLYDDALRMLNFGARQVNLNHALATVGGDRLFTFVISHEDLGVADWLDVDGHTQGFVMLRTKGCLAVETPSLKLMSTAELRDRLPELAPCVTKAERARSLGLRRRHYQRRENC